MPRLIMKRGPMLGATFELEGDLITIGRGSKNQIIIHDNEVSRDHCELAPVQDNYEVRDLGSSNGTFVNGQRVTTTWPLKHGALLELGDSITLEYERLPFPGATQPLLFPGEVTDSTESSTVVDIATDHLGPPRNYSLVMMLGPMADKTYPLEMPLITLGRELNNDIVIQDPEVSRYHLRLRRMRAGYGIEDLGSTNGTQLNARVLQPGKPRTLEDGDAITLGASVELHYTASIIADQETGPNTVTDSNGDRAPQNRDDTLNSSLIRGVRSPVRTSRLGTGLLPGALIDHIFIAYGRSDWEPLIAPLTIGLEDSGVHVWVDQYLTRGSDDWRAAFEQALIETRMMVIVLSPASVQEATVKLAYRHFAKRGRPMLLLVTDSRCVLPPELDNARLLPYEADNPRRTLHRVLLEVMA